MNSPNPSFEETYARLKLAYIDRLKNNLTEIETALTNAQSGPVGHDDLRKIEAIAHGLAGSGTTFGFPDVTQSGRGTESFVIKALKTMTPENSLDVDSLAEFQNHLTNLKEVCEKAITLADMPESGVELGTAKPAAPLDGKKRLSVLIIDDDRNMTGLISLKLSQRNFGVMTAHNGSEALVSMKERRPDVIILDVNMPGLSGHDVLRALKQDADLATIPVLMLTASGKQEDVVGALHSGALDYVVKPIDINDLVGRVERLCRNLSRTILVADNDQLILTLLNHKFRSRGLNVILSDNGERALADIQKHKPDLVILDIKMPGMDGLSVLQAMRSGTDTKNIPAIILSASQNEGDIAASKDAGAQDYVSKPFLADTLLSRCMKILNKE